MFYVYLELSNLRKKYDLQSALQWHEHVEQARLKVRRWLIFFYSTQEWTRKYKRKVLRVEIKTPKRVRHPKARDQWA